MYGYHRDRHKLLYGQTPGDKNETPDTRNWQIEKVLSNMLTPLIH